MQKENNSREENLQDIKNTAQQSGGITEKILDALPIGVSITDRDGRFTFVNPHHLKLYGYEKDELIGQHFSMVVPSEMKEEMRRRHDEFFDLKSDFIGEWEVQRKGGERFHILVNAARLEDEAGQPQKMTFEVDASSLSFSTDSLNATVEMLSRKLDAQELAYHISFHDMRNNIGNITQLAELLRTTKLDDKQSKYVNIIHQLGTRTLQMLKMSADYLKMEKGNYEPQYSYFDLLNALWAEIGAFSKEAENRGLSFHTYLNGKETPFDNEELIISADKGYLERMFGNLIGNAVEASPDNEQISIMVDTKEHLLVQVYNQGAVPAKLRDRFFEKFATADKEEGTGLGTYIAKLVTELHNGKIYFESSEEKGTTLFVELPQEIIQR